ncbi:hypothetical protein ACLOJK_013397 [Asimina triloba]
MGGNRLRDFPSFVRTTDPDDIMLNFKIHHAKRAPQATAVISNTFQDMESEANDDLKALISNIYAVGPLSLLYNQLPESTSMERRWEVFGVVGHKRAKVSVVYVNFGSIAVMTGKQLEEFALGLANSNHRFLWIITRCGDGRIPNAATGAPGCNHGEGPSPLVAWCSQEQVLAHPSEFYAGERVQRKQQTNCWTNGASEWRSTTMLKDDGTGEGTDGWEERKRDEKEGNGIEEVG